MSIDGCYRLLVVYTKRQKWHLWQKLNTIFGGFFIFRSFDSINTIDMSHKTAKPRFIQFGQNLMDLSKNRLVWPLRLVWQKMDTNTKSSRNGFESMEWPQKLPTSISFRDNWEKPSKKSSSNLTIQMLWLLTRGRTYDRAIFQQSAQTLETCLAAF